MRLRFGTIAGVFALGVVLCLSVGTMFAVVNRAESVTALTRFDWQAIYFTFWQAIVSAGLSCGLAVFVARALARRQFFGRSLLITLLGAPFVLPVIVAILGLISVFGQSGMLGFVFTKLGMSPPSIYGYHGVILAHVFFNLPLATRLLLQAWLTIPAERFRLAAMLGFNSQQLRATIEYPMLRQTLPGIFAVIFLVCLTSFAVALALGGGPKATTIELAIYEAFHYDFDLGRASMLAAVLFFVGAIVALFALKLTIPVDQGTGLDRVIARWDDGRAQKFIDAAVIFLAALFLILPLLAVAIRAMPAIALLPAEVYLATGRSLIIAMISTSLMIALAFPIAILCVRSNSKLVEALGYLSIAASPLVLGTGLFIIVFPFMSPTSVALPVTALVNAVMSLPFALRALVPALREVEQNYGKLADGLGIFGFTRLRIIWLPRLRRPIGFALGLTAALSMGDLGVITLFSDGQNATLPLQLFRLMGAYKMSEAAAAALLLMGISLSLFWVFDRWGRKDA